MRLEFVVLAVLTVWCVKLLCGYIAWRTDQIHAKIKRGYAEALHCVNIGVCTSFETPQFAQAIQAGSLDPATQRSLRDAAIYVAWEEAKLIGTSLNYLTPRELTQAIADEVDAYKERWCAANEVGREFRRRLLGGGDTS